MPCNSGRATLDLPSNRARIVACTGLCCFALLAVTCATDCASQNASRAIVIWGLAAPLPTIAMFAGVIDGCIDTSMPLPDRFAARAASCAWRAGDCDDRNAKLSRRSGPDRTSGLNGNRNLDVIFLSAPRAHVRAPQFARRVDRDDCVLAGTILTSSLPREPHRERKPRNRRKRPVSSSSEGYVFRGVS